MLVSFPVVLTKNSAADMVSEVEENRSAISPSQGRILYLVVMVLGMN
jgi:hypothetical protein